MVSVGLNFFEVFLFFFLKFSSLYFLGVFNKTIIPLVFVGYDDYSQLGAMLLVGYLPLFSTCSL